MDAFEQIIGQLLVEEKYWVRHSVKIDLTPEEKRSINKPPRQGRRLTLWPITQQQILSTCLR